MCVELGLRWAEIIWFYNYVVNEYLFSWIQYLEKCMWNQNFKGCFYMNFYQSYGVLFTGSTQQGVSRPMTHTGWQIYCLTSDGQAATRQLLQAHSPHEGAG